MTLPVLMDGRAVNEERLGMLLDGLGLRGHERFLPNQLSGGQQQRVAIGRALMNAPAVVLADEPTGNLDSRNSHEIMALLRESNKRFDQTLVVITHDEDIACMADRVIASRMAASPPTKGGADGRHIHAFHPALARSEPRAHGRDRRRHRAVHGASGRRADQRGKRAAGLARAHDGN